MPASGAGSRLCRMAMRSANRHSYSGFSVGGRRRRKSHVPLTAEQKARCERLRRLAPKPRRKRLHCGPF